MLDIAPTLSFTQRISPTVLTRCAPELCMSFPCGAPTPAPWASLLVPSLCLKSLSVGWTSLSTSFLRVYLPPSQCLSVGLPCRLYRYKYQSHRGKVTELLQGRSRVA